VISASNPGAALRPSRSSSRLIRRATDFLDGPQRLQACEESRFHCCCAASCGRARSRQARRQSARVQGCPLLVGGSGGVPDTVALPLLPVSLRARPPSEAAHYASGLRILPRNEPVLESGQAVRDGRKEAQVAVVHEARSDQCVAKPPKFYCLARNVPCPRTSCQSLPFEINQTSVRIVGGLVVPGNVSRATGP